VMPCLHRKLHGTPRAASGNKRAGNADFGPKMEKTHKKKRLQHRGGLFVLQGTGGTKEKKNRKKELHETGCDRCRE